MTNPAITKNETTTPTGRRGEGRRLGAGLAIDIRGIKNRSCAADIGGRGTLVWDAHAIHRAVRTQRIAGVCAHIVSGPGDDGAAGTGMSAAIAGAIMALTAKPARNNLFTGTLPHNSLCCCISLQCLRKRVCCNWVTFPRNGN